MFSKRSVIYFEKSLSDNSESSAFYKNVFNHGSCGRLYAGVPHDSKKYETPLNINISSANNYLLI